VKAKSNKISYDFQQTYKYFLIRRVNLIIIDGFKCLKRPYSNGRIGWSIRTLRYEWHEAWLRKYGLFNEKHEGIFKCQKRPLKK